MKYEILPCTEDDADFIDEQAGQVINAFALTPEGNAEEEFVYQVTDREGRFLGGCVLAADEWKTAAIYDLWVEEPYRRQGIASALMREAERKARELGCRLALIGTFDFQAKPFYDRHGYTLIAATRDYPKGHEHYFMQKRLDRNCGEAVPSGPCRYEIRPAGEEIAEELSKKLRQYDESCVPREHAYISLSKKVTDGNGTIVAGITGGVDGWNGTEIGSIWVDEPFRGQGIGSALLRAFEQEAKDCGSHLLTVDPYDWNAAFFRKNGYVNVSGVLEDYPKGHTMYCMDKPL